MSEVAIKSSCFNHSYNIEPSQLGSENGKIAINRLPPEILADIFFIGTDCDRGIWGSEPQIIGFQHTASHVCSHWRDVAISTPKLWNFIHIFGLPNEYTALYIARAGNTLLDVLVDMFKLVPFPNFPYNSSLSTKPTIKILQFLTRHGAGANRWRSLLVRFPESDLLPMFIGYLNNNSPAYLRLLHFECASWSFNQTDDTDQLILADDLEDIVRINPSHFLLGSSFQDCASPYSTGLTGLLRSNPQLESLSLQSGDFYRPNIQDHSTIQPVLLSALRSLYISAVDNATWVIHVLSTIKAPNLTQLTIQSFNRCVFGGNAREELVSYLAYGSNTSIGSGNWDSTYAPAYPSLKSFNTFHFPCRKKEFTDLMKSMPQITHLIARRKQAEWLSEAPWMVPTLELLEVPHICIDGAMKILRLRAEASTPIQSIKFQGGSIRLPTSCVKNFDSVGNCGNMMSQYEYHSHAITTEVTGDLKSVQQRLEDFSKEYEDRSEYDLEDNRRDEFFDGD
ncbi:F-box-like protein [Rhizoctonia solani]|uniref:F-box-like protein n=1 Tax=Rhizoctonia solani TaxID=456999 RepID=A0A8H8SSN3_9AGAM|nr:F-box-like protein [Rhizoctonia solani]QRW16749.1 F-box-like protein [Rhizoctonia solani]